MPAATPVTTPVKEPTVAIEVLPLLQVPPVALSVSVVVVPIHRVAVPPIALGVRFTVTILVAALPQPFE